MPARTLIACVIALIGPLSAAADPQPAQTSQRTVFLVPMAPRTSEADYTFLAAIPAAAVSNGGVPVVLAVAEDGKLSPPVADYLRRYTPKRIILLARPGKAKGLSQGNVERIETRAGEAASLALATRFWKAPKTVVVCADNHRNALPAAVIAARLRAPLLILPHEKPNGARKKVLSEAQRVIQVGGIAGPGGAGAMTSVKTERVHPDRAVAWMAANGLAGNYLTVANPTDANSHTVKVSLAAAVLAAGRNGMLLGLRVPPAGHKAASPVLSRIPSRDVKKQIVAACKALPRPPTFLCLAGAPKAIPPFVMPKLPGWPSDVPSDLPYANIDDDPFVDMAFGRVVADSITSATLLVARSLTYEYLDGEWSRRFITAEWESTSARRFENVGFSTSYFRGGKAASKSSLTAAAGIVHDSHSSWMGIGSTYGHGSNVLLAPAVVESGGCSAAALDKDRKHNRSVALRAIRNGAVAFVGNARPGIAQRGHYRAEFWNALLSGSTLGEAHRHALNSVMLNVLDTGQLTGGPNRYQLYNHTLYGDPALAIHLPSKAKAPPARVTVSGRIATVHAPARWWRYEIRVPKDWKYTESPKLYTYRGFGTAPDTRWVGRDHYDADTVWFAAAVDTRKKIDRVRQTSKVAKPLGWTGKWYADEHPDGSRTIRWRVRLIDFDMPTGKIRRKIDRIIFTFDAK